MKISRAYAWHKLAKSILNILSKSDCLKIEGLAESQENLIFLVHYQYQILYQPQRHLYQIRIEVHPAVCALMTHANLDLLQQHFADFLQMKSQDFKANFHMLLPQDKKFFDWEFNLTYLDTTDFYGTNLQT